MTTKKLSAIALLLMSLARVAAAQNFEGRLVHETTGAPIAGSGVHRWPERRHSRTDADGRFGWAPAPSVPFQVVVGLAGGQVARPVLVQGIEDGITSGSGPSAMRQ